LTAERPCQWVCLAGSRFESFFSFFDSYLATKVCYVAGLANYSVPAGEAHSKALEIAREIIQKVQNVNLKDFSHRKLFSTE
jgi:hypothetical protein